MGRLVLLAVIVGVLGCGEGLASSGSEAELYASAADVTSCQRTQSPTGCGPAIQCSGTLAACIESGGCWIVGSGLYLYADGSWRDPEPGPGQWSIVGATPRELWLDGEDVGAVAEGGAAVDFACNAKGGG